MHTTYKNTTNDIVRIEDLNIKFYPRGSKIGHTINLSTLVSAKQIQESEDLKTLVRNGRLAPVSVNPATQPASRSVRPATNAPILVVKPSEKKETNQEESFVVYDRRLKAGRDNPDISGAVTVSLRKAKGEEVPSVEPCEPESISPEPVQTEPVQEEADVETCLESHEESKDENFLPGTSFASNDDLPLCSEQNAKGNPCPRKVLRGHSICKFHKNKQIRLANRDH